MILLAVPAAIAGWFATGAIESWREWWAGLAEGWFDTIVTIVVSVLIAGVCIAAIAGAVLVKGGALRKGGAYYRAVEMIERFGLGALEWFGRIGDALLRPILALLPGV